MNRRCIGCFVLVVMVVGGALNSVAQRISFIENKNQWANQVDFKARVPGGWLSLSNEGFHYQFIDQQFLQDRHEHKHGEAERNEELEFLCGHNVQSRFLNSNRSSKPIPIGRQETYHNYFLGNDSTHWSSRVGLYDGVLYPQLYSGIDLKVYSAGSDLKYDFLVAPGADITQVQLQYLGVDGLSVKEGDLAVSFSLGSLTEKKPVSYQVINGVKVGVKTEYSLNGNIISFCFPEGYDDCYPLVIDPLLIFSTFSGFTADNWGSTATPGENKTLYSAGTVNLANGGDFPATPGAFQTLFGGYFDVGILKYDSSGRSLLYATYLGGSELESPHSLIINSSDELVILGTTSSVNFPTTNGAYDRSYNGGDSTNIIQLTYENGADIFVAKLSSDGAQLISSTYLGGSKNDGLSSRQSSAVKNYGDELRGDVIVTSDGGVVISTVTASSDFPVQNSFDLSFGGGSTDALVVKMDASLSAIQWASFLGGAGVDVSHTVQIDRNGNLYVAGGSNSVDFVMSTTAFQKNNKGDVDGWIAHIKGDGSALLSATFTGTSSFDQVYFVDLDREDNVFVYGQTSGRFPITAGAYNNPNSGQFLQKFNPELSSLLVSTVFGSGKGTPDISPTAFLVNDCNNIYLTGWGGRINSQLGYWSGLSRGLPITNDAFQKTTQGSDFYFIVLSIDATSLLYATYMGGSQSSVHVDGGTSRFDKGGVVYHAVCGGCGGFSDFPTTANAWSRTNRSQNCNNAAFKFDLSSLRARIQTNSVDLKKPGLKGVCLNDKIVFQNYSTGGQTYTWTFGDGQSLIKTDTGRIVYTYKQPGRYTVKLKVVDTGTCVGKDSTSTVVNVFPVLISVGPDQDMCFNNGTRLIASGGVSYQWASKDNVFTSSQATPEVNPKENSTYYVTVTDANGCIKKDTVNIKVIPGIDLNFTYQRINDCYSRTQLVVKNLTDPSEFSYFDFGDGSTSDDIEVRHAYARDGVYTVRLIGVKESCVYEKWVDLPFFNLRVPNVITPGDPGFNDTFKIGYGSSIISNTNFIVSVRIYNRWGNKVYENNRYRDNWAGEGVGPGVYYYEIEIEGEAQCKGWVQVIK